MGTSSTNLRQLDIPRHTSAWSWHGWYLGHAEKLACRNQNWALALTIAIQLRPFTMFSTLVGTFVLMGVTVFVAFRLRNYGHREPRFPPGPPTVPILGNVLQFPRLFPFLHLWAVKYGDIYSLKVLNQTMVVLSSPRAIKDVLDKNGISTSDRFQPYTLLHAEGIYQIFDLASSHRWKAMRKATHTLLAPEALRGYWAFQQTEYLRLLHDVLESPEDIFTHIKRTTASIMTTLIYGKSIPHYAGSKAELFFEGTKCINELVAPFDHPPLDFFPILRHVPERWAPWKTLSKKTKRIRDSFDQDLFLQCEEAVQSGKRPVCFVENVLDTKVELGVSRDEARAMGRVLLDAGTETSASFLHSFVMAMACYPEVQSKAQDEIDRVLRSDQLPLLEDYDDLPYLQAIIKELHRFRPITPAGIPHAASHDTQYNGFVIPEGSIIFMNTWGVFHDPEFFDDPESFNPERYILSEFGTKVGADTEGFRDSLPFGAGRRICPGMDMASRNIAMNAINLLWAFRFSKDTLGICSMDLENYLPGLELALKPFTCNIEVRGEARARLIREAYDAAAM
ncbi:cytochrome P450 family protein [Pleurotus pulmonarius]